MRRSIMLAGLSALLLAAAPPAKLDKKILLMDPASGDALLSQCSRAAPAKGERYFVPTPAEIVAFERRLQLHLETSPDFAAANHSLFARRLPTVSPKPNNWGRDIIGLERGGQRFLYGNYYPSDGSFRKKRKGPLVVCQGGAWFFGAEYDLQGDRITHLAFNSFRS